MLRFFRRGLDEKGQSTAEYIIIVVIVAVLSIAVVTIFGKKIRSLFGYAANQMTDEDAKIIKVDDAAGTDVDRGMGDW